MQKTNLKGKEGFYFHKAVSALGSESTQHYHNTFELYYLKDGSCSYFIDSRIYDAVGGDLILIPSGTIHKTNYGSTPHTRLLVNCTDEYIPHSLNLYVKKLGYLYRNKDIKDKIEEIFLKIEEEYKQGDEIAIDALKCYTGELFILLVRNMQDCTVPESENNLVNKAVKYVNENYHLDISLFALAKMLSVSPEHLSRSFKRTTGFGFCEYLTLIRLQHAEYMLKNEPGRSISEIAYASGFNDSNYFSDKFKRTYGISPMKVKKGAT